MRLSRIAQRPPRPLPFALALALGGVGCASGKPQTPAWYAPQPCDRPHLAGCVIENVSVAGAKQVPESAIKEKIATAESSHTLGGALENIPILSLWDRITVDYEKLDPFVLERDLTRVERIYKARGFYEAHARVARTQKKGKERVSVEIVVDEGTPITIRAVHVRWKDGARPSEKVKGGVDRAIHAALEPLQVGKPFAEDPFEGAKAKLVRAMTDRGYAYAKVEAHAEVDLVAHHADVIYTAELGPPTTFGKVTIEGADGMPVDRLLHVVNIAEGSRYSTDLLDKAQLALGDLRVFGSVDALPQLSKDGEPRVTEVPVVFRVTPTDLKTVKLGFGAALGSRIDGHGVASWENRNFLGGLRYFTIEAKPGLVFPVAATTLLGGSISEPIRPILEMRLHTSLVQPGFIESRTRGLVNADFNLYQQPLNPTGTLGYLEFSGKTGLERDLWDGRVRLGLYFSAQVDVPMQLDFQTFGLIQCSANSAAMALPNAQSTFALDLRRDEDGKRTALKPAHSGIYLSNDVQFALGGASTDVRVRPEARAYIPVSKHTTLALRFAGGLLHPFSGNLTEPRVPDYSYPPDEMLDMTTGCPKEMAGPGEVLRSRWIQVLQLRGFTSGGPNSNRGYAYGGIGPQEVVPGISPLASNGTTPLPIAIGGQALWEASVELRFPIHDKFGMTLFVDGSDVRESLSAFGAPFAPHLSTGLGFRYDTAVGPLRADIGVRIPGAQVFGSPTRCAAYDPSKLPGTDQLWVVGGPTPGSPCYISAEYGQAGSAFGGIPLALSLAIGEAF